MTISELGRQTGIGVETIRYYQRIGIFEIPKRFTRGYRDYDESHLEKLTFILKLKSVGLSLKDIKIIVDHVGQKNHLHLIFQVLESRLKRIDQHLIDLEAQKSRIDELIEKCRAQAV